MQYTTFTSSLARQEFESLVAEYRDTALWYLKPGVHIDLSDPMADTILDRMAEKAPRSRWLAIRKLKKWRSQHFR